MFGWAAVKSHISNTLKYILNLMPFSLRILLSTASSFLTNSKGNIFPSQLFFINMTKLSTSSLKAAKYFSYIVSAKTFQDKKRYELQEKSL